MEKFLLECLGSDQSSETFQTACLFPSSHTGLSIGSSRRSIFESDSRESHVRGTLDAALASRGKRNTAALRKASALRGAASALIFSVRARARTRVQQKRCPVCARARARLLARSRDRPCQLAFSDNFHPPPRPVARSASFYLSLFLAACTFTIARSNCAARPASPRSGTGTIDEKATIRARRPGFAIKSRALALAIGNNYSLLNECRKRPLLGSRRFNPPRRAGVYRRAGV